MATDLDLVLTLSPDSQYFPSNNNHHLCNEPRCEKNIYVPTVLGALTTHAYNIHTYTQTASRRVYAAKFGHFPICSRIFYGKDLKYEPTTATTTKSDDSRSLSAPPHSDTETRARCIIPVSIIRHSRNSPVCPSIVCARSFRLVYSSIVALLLRSQ